MNVIVINLTRFGDLLQSQAALADLVEIRAEIGTGTGAGTERRLALVCLDNFQHTAALLRHIDALFPVPGGALLAGLEKNWPMTLMSLDAWRDDIFRSFAPDVVLNLTPTLPARLLGRFLAGSGGKGRPLSYGGFSLDENGFGHNGSAWATFFQGASRVRGVSPFNVADLFRKVAGGGNGPPSPGLVSPAAAALERAGTLLSLPGRRESRGFVALQPGASEERRRWPAACFAELGARLWREQGLCPVLLGSGAEEPLVRGISETLTGQGTPHVPLAGKTSLEELAAVLTACRLLVSNDTGTLHLAAGLGVPVLGIFLATAQPWDTGPYRAGCCSLEPDLPCHPCAFGRDCPNEEACRAVIRPETVHGIAARFLADGTWSRLPSRDGTVTGARVWKSVVGEDGFMDLISLSGHDGEDRTLWLREQRRLYRQFLDRNPAELFQPSLPEDPLILSPAMAKPLAAELQTALALLDAVMQQGRLLLQRPLPQISERFLATLTRLNILLRESPGLAALSLVWLEEASGTGDIGLAVDLAGQYHSLFSLLLKRVSPHA